MPCRYSEVEILLKKLKKQMLISDLWSDVSPSEAALGSQLPFACDHMPFENWLQFIFIPKMMAIVISKNELPVNLSLMPIAEQSFVGRASISNVLEALAEIDNKFAEFVRS
ncbi:YqcC family protein [Paraglaciecola sp. 2405UD69-4]|uniref:YqcC family protein n=1 Tax=Paraglaciecola sp. 2405UD69-4 TaxID=3391836 RepID=UPI0039C8E985